MLRYIYMYIMVKLMAAFSDGVLLCNLSGTENTARAQSSIFLLFLDLICFRQVKCAKRTRFGP